MGLPVIADKMKFLCSFSRKVPTSLRGTSEDDPSLLLQFLQPAFNGSLRKIQRGGDLLHIPAGGISDVIGKTIHPLRYTATCTAS